MNTLYEISTAFQQVEDLLTDPEFILDEEGQANLAAAYQSIEMDFHAKAENTVKMIRNFEGQAEMLDAEIKRLQARKKTMENKAEILRASLKGSMEATGIDKIKSALFNISLSKPKAGSVVINIPVEELPTEYQKVKIEADKTAIKNDLKEGVWIEGVELETIRTLTIR